MLYLQFTIACVLVILSGIMLTRYGDDLEDAAGLSAGFIGVFLLGAATSLPEFVASFSAIYIVGSPQLSLGNVFGSNMFNLAILGILDLFFLKEILYKKAEYASCIKSMAIGTVMTSLAIAGIYLNSGAYTLQAAFDDSTPMLCFNIFTLLIFLTYIFTLKYSTTEDEKESDGTEAEPDPNYRKKSAATTWAKFLACVVAVVVTGVWLTNLADKIAVVTGLGRTFVGSIFLAAATSLPEATVCLTALRMKSYNLIFGNVFGSNTFNLLILSLTDLLTPHIAMLQVEFIELNIITGTGALIMSAIVLFLMFLKAPAKQMKAFSVVLVMVYLFAYYIMFIQQVKAPAAPAALQNEASLIISPQPEK
jgi:cation:H+ antiporter